MPLINCPDCHKAFSSLANTCPHCGRPFNVTYWTLGRISLAIIFGILILVFTISLPALIAAR
jgi:hypothetical protein